MKFSTAAALALAAVTALATAPSSVGALNPITIKGYKMFDVKTGEYFAAKGVDYYPRPNAGELDANNIDFFTDDHEDIWGKDIEHIAAAGANAIRLYAVDPTKSHDKFMCALNALGIYVLVDLGASCKGCAITNDKYPACYPPTLKTRGEQIILAFAKYDNVLGFSAGNEVNHVVTDAKINAPCQKKFLRDMRKFLDDCSKAIRSVPVGVVLADHQREENAKYYNCRTDPSDKFENAEWYGLNAYQHCDSTVTEKSKATGFTKMASDFVEYGMSIPVMLTEFGCLNKGFPTVDGYDAQRTWLQAGWLFSEDMRKAFSGGFTFEFSTENANSKADAPYPFTSYGAQNYGLGYYSPENCDHATVPCEYNPMPNYDNLAKQFKSVKISGEATLSTFAPKDRTAPPKCPADFANLKSIKWDADAVTSQLCPPKVVTFSCPAVASTPSSSLMPRNRSSTTATSTTSRKTTLSPAAGGSADADTSNANANANASANETSTQTSSSALVASASAMAIALSTAAAVALFM